MRTQFTAELIALTNDLTLMCSLAHDAVERVIDALVDADLTATYEVFALDEQLQKMYGAGEARTVLLLALQAPVARDLRHVVTAIQMAGELSQIGLLASRVADQVYKSHPAHVAQRSVLEILAEMGRLAAARTASAGRAVAGHQLPPEDAPGAHVMETLHRQLHSALVDPASQSSTVAAIDIALLGHHLERCIDHTARIERLIRFSTPEFPRRPSRPTTSSPSDRGAVVFVHSADAGPGSWIGHADLVGIPGSVSSEQRYTLGDRPARMNRLRAVVRSACRPRGLGTSTVRQGRLTRRCVDIARLAVRSRPTTVDARHRAGRPADRLISLCAVRW